MPDPDARYHHTQAGFVILGAWALGMLIAMPGVRSVANTTPAGTARTAILALVAIVVIYATIVSLLFSSLTIDIRDGILQWHFTGSFIRGNVLLRDIEGVAQVRNSAAHGWGLRKTPEGTLYSVSGLDAVRIRMRDGRRFNLGSDEASTLLQAIEHGMAVSLRR